MSINTKNTMRVANVIAAMPERFTPHRVVGRYCNVVGFAAMLALVDQKELSRVLTEQETYALAEEFTGIPHNHPLFQGFGSDWKRPHVINVESTVDALQKLASGGLEAKFTLEGRPEK